MARKHASHPGAIGKPASFRRNAHSSAGAALQPAFPKRSASTLFEQIAKGSSLPAGQLRDEIIPHSSWKRAGTALTSSASQAALRVQHIFNLAKSIWGEPDAASRWLNRPHPELAGATPMSFLRTESGGRRVEELLIALEHGFPV